MVNLRKITHANLVECIKLKVSKEQEGFVDSNVESLAEAYASITNGGFATPYAVYDGDSMVGFTMYTYFDKQGAYDITDLPAPYTTPSYYVWRILIDKAHQRKGYGRQTIEAVIDEIKTKPYGEASRIYTSWRPDNIGSKTLFTSLGFEETGEVEGCLESGDYEIVAKLDI